MLHPSIFLTTSLIQGVGDWGLSQLTLRGKGHQSITELFPSTANEIDGKVFLISVPLIYAPPFSEFGLNISKPFMLPVQAQCNTPSLGHTVEWVMLFTFVVILLRRSNFVTC